MLVLPDIVAWSSVVECYCRGSKIWNFLPDSFYEYRHLKPALNTHALLNPAFERHQCLSVFLSVCPSVHLNVCSSVVIIWYICVRMFAVCAWMRYMCTGLITADAIRNVRWHQPLRSSFSVNSLRLAQAPLFRSNATLWGFASIGFDSFPVEPRRPIMTYC